METDKNLNGLKNLWKIALTLESKFKKRERLQRN